jgi:hypothetical protein
LCGIGGSQWRTNHAAHATTIDTLPDDVLLVIFDIFRLSGTDLELRHKPVWNWHILIHVCRRWRQVVFASPLRLDLQLLCTPGTPVRKYLGCWPAFPIAIDYENGRPFSHGSIFEDDVIAALEHPNRVRHIKLTITPSFWRKLAPLLQEPFPVLTLFSICSVDMNVPFLPSGFLGGSAPCLQEIRFRGMPTLALPTLLPPASNLVSLVLFDSDIPQSGISPAALVTGLAMLPRLNNLSIAFVPWSSHTSHWQIRPLPQTRVVLPVLNSFSFDGEGIFLEEFVSQIDTPMLNSIEITYLDFPGTPIPQLSEFLKRSNLKPSLFRNGKIYFDDGDEIHVFVGPGADPEDFPFAIHIPSCEGIYDQVSCMAKVLNHTSTMLSNVVSLEIKAEQLWRLDSEDEDLDRIDWLELLRPFTTVETLNVSLEFSEMIAHALEEMPAETAHQVLPALNLLLLEGEPMESDAKLFATLRNRDCPLPSRPLTIMHYEGSVPEFE